MNNVLKNVLVVVLLLIFYVINSRANGNLYNYNILNDSIQKVKIKTQLEPNYKAFYKKKHLKNGIFVSQIYGIGSEIIFLIDTNNYRNTSILNLPITGDTLYVITKDYKIFLYKVRNVLTCENYNKLYTTNTGTPFECSYGNYGVDAECLNTIVSNKPLIYLTFGYSNGLPVSYTSKNIKGKILSNNKLEFNFTKLIYKGKGVSNSFKIENTINFKDYSLFQIERRLNEYEVVIEVYKYTPNKLELLYKYPID